MSSQLLMTYQHKGLTLPYLDSGAGIPVILLHGFPEDAHSWHRVIPHLTAAGLRVIVPEMRGYAATANPRDKAAYSLAQLMGDIIALLDHLQLDRAHLVGHDLGGLLAWELAMRYPLRFQTLTALGTPHPQAMVWSYGHSGQLFKSAYIGGFQVPRIPENLVARILPATLKRAGLNATDTAALATRFATPASLTGPLNWYRGLFVNAPVPPADALVRVPTTYVWGNHDPFLGRTAAVKTQTFVAADYRFLVLNAGHWLPEQRPLATAQAIINRTQSH